MNPEDKSAEHITERALRPAVVARKSQRAANPDECAPDLSSTG
jgi:hypothetical protein